jgi:hypothetical protein
MTAVRQLQLNVAQDKCAALYFYLKRLEIELQRKY